MANELIIHGSRIEVPPARTPGMTALAPMVARLPQWFPPGTPGAQLAIAILTEANQEILRECSPASVIKCAFNAAVVGLPPGGVFGFCHFIPFGKDATLVMGYKGWLELAYSNDFLRDVHCEVVLKGEKFRRWNDEGGARIRHELALERDPQWEDIEAAYCIWHSRSGGSGFEIVGRRALETLKRRGETKRNSVWKSNPVAMCLKTPIIRSAKTWRKTDRISMAGALEDAIDADISQPSLVAEPLEIELEKPQLEAFAESVPAAPDSGNADDEAVTIAQWREEIATLESPGALQQAKRNLPHNISLGGQQTILSAIEMREAALRGKP